MKSIRAGALGLGLALTPLAMVASADDHGLEQVLAESADTPAEHQALAIHYKHLAEEAKAGAAAHRAMAKTYSGTKYATAKAMTDHCDNLASLGDQEAAEYEALAAAHEAAAK